MTGVSELITRLEVERDAALADAARLRAMLERVTYALNGINQGGGAITVEELADTNRDAQALLAGGLTT